MEGQPASQPDAAPSAAPAQDTPADASASVPESGAPAASVAAEATPVTPADESAPETAEEAAQTDPQPKPSRRQREEAQRLKAEREARQQADEDALARRVEEAIARRTKAAEEATNRERAEREKVQRYGKFTGEAPADPANPSGQTLYDQVRAEATRPIPNPSDYATQDEWDAFNRAVATQNVAKARLAEFDERRQMFGEFSTPLEQAANARARSEALAWLDGQFQRGLETAGLDPADILGSASKAPPDERLPAIVKALADHYESKYSPRIAELEEKAEADASEIDALRRQLGGHAPGPARGGTAGDARAFTRADLANMSIEEYRRNRAEIDRQAAAGLIR